MPNGPDGKPMALPAHMRNLRDDMQQLVDEVAEGGIPYLVCAISQPALWMKLKVLCRNIKQNRRSL